MVSPLFFALFLVLFLLLLQPPPPPPRVLRRLLRRRERGLQLVRDPALPRRGEAVLELLLMSNGTQDVINEIGVREKTRHTKPDVALSLKSPTLSRCSSTPAVYGPICVDSAGVAGAGGNHHRRV